MVDAIAVPGLSAFRRVALGEVDSTNSVTLDFARRGDPGNLWVTAARQLAGRGRRGRAWVSEAGNLYASLLLVDPAPVPAIGTLPLVAALAVHRALAPLFAGRAEVLAIKWPNDVLVDGRKVNGILLESERLADGRLAVVIGCGINVAHHPDDPAYPATDLQACGIDAGIEPLFQALARAMAKALAEWDRAQGFAAIRAAWLAAARGLGEPVAVNLADGTLHGWFEGIDAEGYLMLRAKDGARHRISAGDLFFSTEGVPGT